MKKHAVLKSMLLILLAASVLLCFGGCGSHQEEEETENPLDAGAYDASGNLIRLKWYPDAKMNEIRDENWVLEGDKVSYSGGEYKSSLGIDVSSNQEVIDWPAVKASGIDFAIMRTGYRRYGAGIIEADTMFDRNMQEAKEAGVRIGVYFFSQAVNETEAEEEARFVLDMIEGYELDLPVYYDTEEITYDSARTDGLSGEQFTLNAIAFCEYVKSAGYEPGVYASQMWLCNKMDLMRLENYSIWLAKYTDVLNYPYDIDIWQYSSEGRVEGINTIVDMDVMVEKK